MIFPKLSTSLTKGACGRIGIIGGSSEYTGAPYFSAMASLLVGSDLVYVFTHRDAAPIIKSYSPDLIVFPLFSNSCTDFEIPRVLQRLSALVVGPGLSNSPILLESAFKFIQEASKFNIPLIIDADALLLVSKYPNVFAKSVLTPNYREFQRLCTEFNLVDVDSIKNVENLALKLNATIVLKGSQDIITNGIETKVCDTEPGLRRVGGIGDILAGTLATFIGWSNSIDQCYEACRVVRAASCTAYLNKKRAMRAGDVLEELGSTAQKLLFDI